MVPTPSPRLLKSSSHSDLSQLNGGNYVALAINATPGMASLAMLSMNPHSSEDCITALFDVSMAREPFVWTIMERFRWTMQ